MTGYLVEIGQAGLALLLAPGLVGFIRWEKARLQGRRGAAPWQP
jgi:formate hydrogenlyase subunit 4